MIGNVKQSYKAIRADNHRQCKAIAGNPTHKNLVQTGYCRRFPDIASEKISNLLVIPGRRSLVTSLTIGLEKTSLHFMNRMRQRILTSPSVLHIFSYLYFTSFTAFTTLGGLHSRLFVYVMWNHYGEVPLDRRLTHNIITTILL